MATVPIETLLRRTRLERGLTQAKLATLANVTQGAISNYERGVMMPADSTLSALAEALQTDIEALRKAVHAIGPPPPPAASPLQTFRSALINTVSELPDAGVWQQAAAEINGDLAFSHAVGDWLYLVVVDGAGAGPAAAMSSIVIATFVLGAIRGAKGVSWPSDVLEQAERLPDALGGPGQGALLVVLFERAKRSLYHARSQGMPAPFLRDSRVATSALSGRESRLGRFREGRVDSVASNALLLLATDGIANASRAKGQPLWSSPDIRTWLTRARSAEELATRVGERASTGRPAGADDDMLAVAVGL